RKNKPEPSSASRHYDNDNLPTDQALSVVGPPPSSDANADAAKPATVDPAPSVTVRDVNWNKDDERYKSDLEEKQKAVAAARQELDEMQEKAHKAGVAEDEKDSSKDNNKDSNKDK